jgi:hypothetical protein
MHLLCPSSANLFYIASGGSDDFAHGAAGIPYVYTIELPDEGTFGFLLPPSQIAYVGKETFAGLTAYAKELMPKNHLLSLVSSSVQRGDDLTMKESHGLHHQGDAGTKVEIVAIDQDGALTKPATNGHIYRNNTKLAV